MCTAYAIWGHVNKQASLLRPHLQKQKSFCVDWLFIWGLRFGGEAPWAMLLYFFLPLTSLAEQGKRKERDIMT